MTELRHYLEGNIRWPLSVAIIGCGGNGAQMASGLAAIQIALKEIGDRSIEVTIFDNDVVTKANIGRQPFFPCDIGRNKADALTERINMAYGFNWTACPQEITRNTKLSEDLVISCVDTIKSRQEIYKSITSSSDRYSNKLRYWLDLGNTEFTGQAVLGKINNTKNGKNSKNPPLPHFFEKFPHLLQEDIEEDNSPSCSLAEALKRQSLFVNRTLASHSLSMLYELFVNGSVGAGGVYLNLKSGITIAMPLEAKTNKSKPRIARKKPKQDKIQ